MHAYNVNQGTYDFYHSELDEFDTQTVRFKPESLDTLVKLTKFDKRELKLMYRGFKQEDKFKLIYAQFFPRGSETNGYARFVFNSFDVQRKQEITFTDFVIGLSVLTRGTTDERLRWIFTLYDLNGDGIITRDELNKVVNSIHDLMGRFAFTSGGSGPVAPSCPAATAATQAGGENDSSDQRPQGPLRPHHKRGHQQATPEPGEGPQLGRGSQAGATANTNLSTTTTSQTNSTSSEDQAESLFRKFDLNSDGAITLDEFIEACHRDENIIRSISVFNTVL